MYEKKSWLKFYGHVPHTLNYPRVTMYEALKRTVQEHPDDPAQVEDILYKHPKVQEARIVGVPDEAQVQAVKAFVVLKNPADTGAETEKELIDYCRDHLIKWSCPRQIEFRSELPKTLVGKVAFKVLEQEEIARLKAAGKFTGA